MRLFFYLLVSFTLWGQDFSLTKFGSPLNTQNNEYSPVISPNGRYIVFQSNRPGGEGGMDIWISENKNYQNRTEKPIWSEPLNFRELNTRGFEGPFSILFDSSGRPIEIYFTSLKDTQTGRTGLAGLNIYYVKNLTNKNPAKDLWSKPEHLIRINTNFDEKMPAISPDGKTLIFSSNRPGGFGGWDLWISTRDKLDGTWSEPINLGPKINTSANEIMPSFHFDGTSIFFSSDRDDKNYRYSLYLADFDDPSLQVSEGEIEEPYPNSQKSPNLPKVLRVKKLPPPINSSADDEGISLTLDGLWIYFASNREGGEGQFDIYRVPVTDALRKPYAFDLKGLVVDGSESTMIGLDSTIKIYNSEGLVKIITSKRIGGDIVTKEKNPTEPINFQTRLLTGDTYKIEVSSPGFHPNQFTLDLQGNVGIKKSKYVKVILMPVDEEQEISKEEPETKKEPPISTEDEKKTPVKEEGTQKPSIIVYLKDAKTKEIISNGKVTLFVEKEREGKQLEKDKEAFKIFPIPEEDFEITGKAKGYKPETLFVTKDDKEKRNSKELTIYLQKRSDYAKIYDTPIYFEFNEYKILDSQKKPLDEFATYLKKNKEKVEVGGHTDNIASKDFNYKLSLKRAEAIINYLLKKGISKERLIPKGYWYSQPVADNSTEEGRAKNRRVTFKKIE